MAEHARNSGADTYRVVLTGRIEHLRRHCREHRCDNECCRNVEERLDQLQTDIDTLLSHLPDDRLDQIQAALGILLARTAPDTTPASITLTAH